MRRVDAVGFYWSLWSVAFLVLILDPGTEGIFIPTFGTGKKLVLAVLLIAELTIILLPFFLSGWQKYLSDKMYYVHALASFPVFLVYGIEVLDALLAG